MRPQERATARASLDKKLESLRKSVAFARPPRGWIRAIREALGMTTAQLGNRMGVSQPRVVAIEKAELSGSITLDSLERAARALDCHLVYALVPREPLETQVIKQAHTLARERLSAIAHNMSLEGQRVGDEDSRAQLDQMIRKLLNGRGSRLWETP